MIADETPHTKQIDAKSSDQNQSIAPLKNKSNNTLNHTLNNTLNDALNDTLLNDTLKYAIVNPCSHTLVHAPFVHAYV